MIPPRDILAVVNFSESSRAALILAARLARHCGAELHVLHAEAPMLDAAARQAGIDLARETYDALRRFVADSGPAALCSPQLHVIAGPAVDVILDVAHQHRADLVVVDRSSRSSMERFLFGSTTEGLLRRADVSVLVGPTEWTPHHSEALNLSDLGPLLVVVDPSDQLSAAAARAARQLASVLGTSVEIVRVVPDADRAASARKELEHVIGLTNRLAEAAGSASDRAPILMLSKKAPGSKGAAPGTIAARVLSAVNLPILMYVADQIAWM
jgi:nucleotide-binding universal stress UspA family protein